MIAALAGVVVVLLLANGATLAVRVVDRNDGPPVPATLKPVLAELEAFVAQTRGLHFKHPPKVQLIPDSKFDGLLLDNGPGGADSTSTDDQTMLGVLRALGLVGDKVDLGAVAKKQVGDIVGFYDAHKKALYVRGVAPTPYAKEVLVHELTHALDDQHFGLDRPALTRTGGDPAFAFQALVEGSALRIEQKWYESRSQQERDAIDSVDNTGAAGRGDPAKPDVFTRLMAFPYAVGLPFATAIVAAGGQARLDDTFRHPPVTTEQVLHPDQFLTGEGHRKVPLPAADGRVVDQGSLGELGLLLVTGTTSSRSDSLQASQGWAGDSYRAWRQDNRTCIRWNIEMDSDTDTGELVTALQAWAAGQPGATVTQPGPVEVANCR